MDTSSYSEIDISDKMDTSPDEYICRDICRYYYIKKDNVPDYIHIPILYYGKECESEYTKWQEQYMAFLGTTNVSCGKQQSILGTAMKRKRKECQKKN